MSGNEAWNKNVLNADGTLTEQISRCLKAKFHYTDPTGPARTQRSFAAKKVRAGPVGSVSGPCSGI